MSHPNPMRHPAGVSSLPALVRHLKRQRRRITALAATNALLRTRGKSLLTDAHSLAEKLVGSHANLARTFLATQAAAENFEPRGSDGEHGVQEQWKGGEERMLRDAPDMVEALRQAAEILKLEFEGTEGSGQDTLVKCEKVLRRTRSVCSIELRLY